MASRPPRPPSPTRRPTHTRLRNLEERPLSRGGRQLTHPLHHRRFPYRQGVPSRLPKIGAVTLLANPPMLPLSRIISLPLPRMPRFPPHQDTRRVMAHNRAVTGIRQSRAITQTLSRQPLRCLRMARPNAPTQSLLDRFPHLRMSLTAMTTSPLKMALPTIKTSFSTMS